MTTFRDEIERDMLLLNHKGLFNARLEQFQHLMIVEIIANVLKNVLVWHNVQSTEDDHNRDLLFDERQISTNVLGRRDRRTGATSVLLQLWLR